MPEYTRRLVERIVGRPAAPVLAPRPVPAFTQPDETDPLAALGPRAAPATPPLAPALASAAPIIPTLAEPRRSISEWPGLASPLPRERRAPEPLPAPVERDAGPWPPRRPAVEPIEERLPLPTAPSESPRLLAPEAPLPPAPPPPIPPDGPPQLERPTPRLEPRLPDRERAEPPGPSRRETSVAAPPPVERLSPAPSPLPPSPAPAEPRLVIGKVVVEIVPPAPPAVRVVPPPAAPLPPRPFGAGAPSSGLFRRPRGLGQS
jgi:hypothetical protein